MWRSLYDMFTDSPEEQQLYHSIATVGTLLLQIGEVGKRFRHSSSSSGISAEDKSSPVVELKASSSAAFGDSGIAKEAAVKSADVVEVDKKVEQAPSATGAQGDAVAQSQEGNGEDSHSTKPDHDDDKGAELLAEPQAMPVKSPITSADSENGSPKNTSKPDDDWSISFEQLLASVLTESPLVDFFERIYETTDAVAALRNRRLVTRVNPAPDSKS